MNTKSLESFSAAPLVIISTLTFKAPRRWGPTERRRPTGATVAERSLQTSRVVRSGIPRPEYPRLPGVIGFAPSLRSVRILVLWGHWVCPVPHDTVFLHTCFRPCFFTCFLSVFLRTSVLEPGGPPTGGGGSERRRSSSATATRTTPSRWSTQSRRG